MRLRLSVVALTAVLLTLPVSAQTADFFARWIEATREGSTLVHGGAAVVNLNAANGLEAGVDLFWGAHVSTELSVSSVRHELDAAAFGQSVDLGEARVMPYSAILELHTDPQGSFDCHLGAGASLVKFGKVADGAELALLGIRSIEFHDKIAPVASAGFSYRLGGRTALTVDAKWFDIRTRTTATYLDGTTEGASLNLRQLSAGAGLSFRF